MFRRYHFFESKHFTPFTKEEMRRQLAQEFGRHFEVSGAGEFLVVHPSWGYFADTYELIQVPIENEGKAPGARTLTTLIEQAKREKVKVIFVQPQFDKRTATQLASAIGAQVIAIDPLASDYADNLREVARRITAALQR